MSLVSVYCARLRLQHWGCLERGLHPAPSHCRRLGPSLAASPLHPPARGHLGASCTGRGARDGGGCPRARARTHRGARLRDPAAPSSSSSRFQLRRTSLVWKPAAEPGPGRRVYRCLCIELHRAPVHFQRLRLLSINNERGSEYIQQSRVWQAGRTLEPLQGRGGWGGGGVEVEVGARAQV